ncbi:flagellar biosynthesis anti-sigma factor FlgM [Uliginosibacterium sp. H1]|uniref:flagellar biosynthesis anti-sigma factor FlgM n=1 Tax=Uliginosibacterium sp. H1 TaxID=3114757 RepID=UPI0028065CD3|nr:flagellar biosynthesis anti-sigma factor FlgM [Moraxellaceae bacterium]MEC5397244.1 flagellar biosynthesis anti-sigma factor FlgM [Uliginosibacterium sp. H1]
MKIDNTLKPVSTSGSDNKSRVGREAPAETTSSESKVELSSRLAQLDSVLNNSPVVDSGKVEEIKQAITEGRFKVNPEKVADGLIDSVRQMLAAQPRTA